MYNLLIKELKLGISPFFYVLPFLTGALMLIPAWLYFLVTLYFCFITMPNLFGGYKSQNDLMFTSMLPVKKSDMVKAKISFIVILELLHIVTAVIYGLISIRLYPNMTYYFFAPSFGFWGLSFVMLAIFNIIFIPMYYKTAYKYGAASIASITAAILFAVGAEWLGIQNSFVNDLFKGAGAESLPIQITLLLSGIAVFAICTIIAYYIANKRFEKVEM
ncbi:putative ABC-type exoprotein transport system permease subunit [Paenibacillus endophyticus]|uniref:Putative ABC-type exoprotein transport system permease subunit n=1 Tax=Paenibacillus endophyticus TaxID=1294268 RepID=A0A7W5GA02_9BACL|nr:ABC-2 transporter permease [Paenibacillus endophyticus]MBB3151482.1 putative ABC-type exoprotein transport system permease subunit [Paenibacillus endophyticus]